MALGNDWTLPVLLAVLLLLLAKAMAAEKSEPAATSQHRSGKPPATFETPPQFKAQVVEECSASAPAPTSTQFTLKDPHGTTISSESIYKATGMLVMVSVPNLTQYERQKKWERYMKGQRWPQQCAPQRVLIEDLSQQQTYKEKARFMMKQAYKPGGDTVVLVDEDGDVRRQLGVQNNETVIVLVDTKGRVLHVESDDVEPDQEAAHRLNSFVCKLADQCVRELPPAKTIVATASATAPSSQTQVPGSAATMMLMSASPRK